MLYIYIIIELNLYLRNKNTIFRINTRTSLQFENKLLERILFINMNDDHCKSFNVIEITIRDNHLLIMFIVMLIWSFALLSIYCITINCIYYQTFFYLWFFEKNDSYNTLLFFIIYNHSHFFRLLNHRVFISHILKSFVKNFIYSDIVVQYTLGN